MPRIARRFRDQAAQSPAVIKNTQPHHVCRGRTYVQTTPRRAAPLRLLKVVCREAVRAVRRGGIAPDALLLPLPVPLKLPGKPHEVAEGGVWLVYPCLHGGCHGGAGGALPRQGETAQDDGRARSTKTRCNLLPLLRVVGGCLSRLPVWQRRRRFFGTARRSPAPSSSRHMPVSAAPSAPSQLFHRRRAGQDDTPL